jgi:hypothetical protein
MSQIVKIDRETISQKTFMNPSGLCCICRSCKQGMMPFFIRETTRHEDSPARWNLRIYSSPPVGVTADELIIFFWAYVAIAILYAIFSGIVYDWNSCLHRYIFSAVLPSLYSPYGFLHQEIVSILLIARKGITDNQCCWLEWFSVWSDRCYDSR